MKVQEVFEELKEPSTRSEEAEPKATEFVSDQQHKRESEVIALTAQVLSDSSVFRKKLIAEKAVMLRGKSASSWNKK